MSIKKDNKHVVALRKAAAEYAEGTGKPYFTMVEQGALALKTKGIADQDDFNRLLDDCRAKNGDGLIEKSLRSRTWSCVELGKFACVEPLFTTLRKMPVLPGVGGVYDIACSIRKTGPFAKGKPQEKNAIGLAWDEKRPDAPTLDALQNALRLGNVERNKGKTRKPQAGLVDELNDMIKRLALWRDGKVNVIDIKTGKARKDGDSVVKFPAVKGDIMDAAIRGLEALKGKVVPLKKGSNGKGEAVAPEKMSKAQLMAALKAMTAAA